MTKIGVNYAARWKDQLRTDHSSDIGSAGFSLGEASKAPIMPDIGQNGKVVGTCPPGFRGFVAEGFP
jgi:hypothetical protein